MAVEPSGLRVIKLGNQANSYDQYDADWNYEPVKVYGQRGNDIFSVATRGSQFHGELGNDAFHVWFSIDIIVEKNIYDGGAGIDTIDFNEIEESGSTNRVVNLDKGFTYCKGRSGTVSHKDQIVGIENIVGSFWSDELIGSKAANVIRGAGGADIVRGLDGNDSLYGGSGPVYEYVENDRLIGGKGNDLLVGQDGADILEGGPGKDTFKFEAATDSTKGDRDVIKDFRAADRDKLDLSDIDANLLKSGNQAFSFIGSAGLSKTAGELTYRSGILSGDTNGDGVADLEISLLKVATLKSTDFFL